MTEQLIETTPGGHLFQVDPDTEDIDAWVLGAGFHNGPACRACDDAWCHHCGPDVYSALCPAREGQAEIEVPGVIRREYRDD